MHRLSPNYSSRSTYNRHISSIWCIINPIFYYNQAFLSLIGSLIRLFSLWSQTGNVSALAILPIEYGRVACNAVIPDDHCTRLPSDASLQVLRQRDVVIKEFEQVVRLLLLVSDDGSGDYNSCQYSWVIFRQIERKGGDGAHIAG